MYWPVRPGVPALPPKVSVTVVALSRTASSRAAVTSTEVAPSPSPMAVWFPDATVSVSTVSVTVVEGASSSDRVTVALLTVRLSDAVAPMRIVSLFSSNRSWFGVMVTSAEPDVSIRPRW